MGWRVWATVLLAASAWGCADSVDATTQTNWFCGGAFRIDPELEAQRDDIKAAMARWNAFLGRDYFRASESARCTIRPGSLGFPLAEFQIDTMTLDLPNMAKCNRKDGVALQSVVMHELGHAMGMGHVEGAIVMAPSAGCNEPALIDPNDLDREECIRATMCAPDVSPGASP